MASFTQLYDRARIKLLASGLLDADYSPGDEMIRAGDRERAPSNRDGKRYSNEGDRFPIRYQRAKSITMRIQGISSARHIQSTQSSPMSR